VGTFSSTGLAVTGDISTSGSGNREISINTTSNASSYLKYNVWGMDRAYIRAEAANPGAGSGTGSGKLIFELANNPTMTTVGTWDNTGFAVTGAVTAKSPSTATDVIYAIQSSSSNKLFNVSEGGSGAGNAYVYDSSGAVSIALYGGTGEITATGNLTAAPSTGQQILFGSTGGSTTSKAFIGFDQTDKAVGLGITNTSTTRTGYFLYFFNDTGGSNGYINQVNNTTVAYTTTSDVRLKNNIRDFQNSGSIIDAIKPRTFDWNWGGKDATGFIAQELNEVFPEAVSAGDVGDEIDKTWGVDPAKLVPVLVAEIQSLRRRLAALESK
jgi:hypothetical protein